MLRVLFCGGGSVGHLSPSIAVWETLQNKALESRALFVCAARREDMNVLKAHGVSRIGIHAPKSTNLFLLPLLPIAFLEALIVLLWFRPNVIFAKGGYVSVPVCVAAWILYIPIVLHESDRVMGKANRRLLRFARHLCIGTPQKELVDSDIMAKTTIPITATGNPIRSRIAQGTRDGGMRVTSFSGKRPVLLVIGGSQGSQIINEALWEVLPQLLEHCDVVHLTGAGKMNPAVQHSRYIQLETMWEEIGNLLALADIVVSRAGASAIAELSTLGKASVLIPIPHLANAHQEENAHFLAAASAAVVLRQDMMKETLANTILELASNKEQRIALGERLAALSDPNAAERIANILVEESKIKQ